MRVWAYCLPVKCDIISDMTFIFQRHLLSLFFLYNKVQTIPTWSALYKFNNEMNSSRISALFSQNFGSQCSHSFNLFASLFQIECRMALDEREQWRKRGRCSGSPSSRECRRCSSMYPLPGVSSLRPLLEGRGRKVSPSSCRQCGSRPYRATSPQCRCSQGGGQSRWGRLHTATESRRRRTRGGPSSSAGARSRHRQTR